MLRDDEWRQNEILIGPSFMEILGSHRIEDVTSQLIYIVVYLNRGRAKAEGVTAKPPRAVHLSS